MSKKQKTGEYTDVPKNSRTANLIRVLKTAKATPTYRPVEQATDFSEGGQYRLHYANTQKEPTTREAAAIALGKLGDIRALDALIDALADPSMEVRKAVVGALGRIDKTRFVPPSGAKRKKSIPARLLDFLKATFRIWNFNGWFWPKRVEITVEGKKRISALLSALKDEEIGVRAETERVLAKLYPGWAESDEAKRLVPAFITALNNGTPKEKEAAAIALGKFRDHRALDALIEAVKDPGVNVRKASVHALGLICMAPYDSSSGADNKNTLSANPLFPKHTRIGRMDVDVRTPEQEDMRINVKKRRGALISVLKDNDRGIREMAERILNRIDLAWERSGEAKLLLPKFISALKNEDHGVRESAESVLSKVDPGWARSGEAKLLLPEFISALKNKNHDVQRASECILNKIDPEWPKTEEAKQQVPAFISALKTSANSARVLGLIGDDMAKGPLISAMRSEDYNIRFQVRAALDRIDPMWLKSREADRQVPYFIAGLKDKTESIRQISADMLGEIGSPSAVNALISALDDTERVRRVAAYSLGLLKDERAIDPIVEAVKSGRLFKDTGNYVLSKILEANRPFLDSFPEVICSKCARRPRKVGIRVNVLSKRFELIKCTHCNSSVFLVADVREMIGIIGGGYHNQFQHQGKKAMVHLWNEEEKKARDADIDSLVIRVDGLESIERAINAVILELTSDVSKPKNWLKTVPVRLEGTPAPGKNVMNMLKEYFRLEIIR